MLKPKHATRQAWFWTKTWQDTERQAEMDIKTHRVKRAKSVHQLIRSLKRT